MTLVELQELLDQMGLVVSHMGWAARQARGKPATRWSVTLTPATGSRYPEMPRVRGVGGSLDAAVENALNQVTTFHLVHDQPV